MGQQQPTSLPEDEDNRISAIMTYPIRARYNNNNNSSKCSSCIETKPTETPISSRLAAVQYSSSVRFVPPLPKESYSNGLPRHHLPMDGFLIHAREGRQEAIYMFACAPLFSMFCIHIQEHIAALFLSLIESDISMGLNYIVSLLTKDSGWGSTEFSPQSFLDTHIRCCCCYYSTRLLLQSM